MSHLFITTIEVTADHLDDLNHVNNVQYLLWAQEIAKAHWQEINDLAHGDGVWMVRNHEVEYRLGGFLGDTIRIETHVKSVRGPLSQRIVEFYNDKNDQLLVSCKTQWCYVDPSTRKPMKVADKIEKLFLSEEPPF